MNLMRKSQNQFLKPPKFEAVATHESGHAIVAQLVGLPVESISMISDRSAEACVLIIDAGSIATRSVASLCAFHAGGVAAEILIRPRVSPYATDHWHGDFCAVSRLLSAAGMINETDAIQAGESWERAVSMAAELLSPAVVQNRLRELARHLRPGKIFTGFDLQEILPSLN